MCQRCQIVCCSDVVCQRPYNHLGCICETSGANCDYAIDAERSRVVDDLEHFGSKRVWSHTDPDPDNFVSQRSFKLLTHIGISGQ